MVSCKRWDQRRDLFAVYSIPLPSHVWQTTQISHDAVIASFFFSLPDDLHILSSQNPKR